MQDEEKDKDAENAKKVHNILNNITEEHKGPTTTTTGAFPQSSGPAMAN